MIIFRERTERDNPSSDTYGNIDSERVRPVLSFDLPEPEWLNTTVGKSGRQPWEITRKVTRSQSLGVLSRPTKESTYEETGDRRGSSDSEQDGQLLREDRLNCDLGSPVFLVDNSTMSRVSIYSSVSRLALKLRPCVGEPSHIINPVHPNTNLKLSFVRLLGRRKHEVTVRLKKKDYNPNARELITSSLWLYP